MTGWEVQEMEEMARNSQWEEMCMKQAADNYGEAALNIGMALSNLDRAVEWMEETANALTGCAEYDRVISLKDDLESLISSIGKIHTRLDH